MQVGLKIKEREFTGFPSVLLGNRVYFIFPGREPQLYEIVFNRVLGAVLLLISLPAMAIIAILLKLEGTGRQGVLYRGERVGLNCKPFIMYKFRTLRCAPEEAFHRVSKISLDTPKASRLGRFLRNYKLDELPQLINVIRGEMNIVGPRPQRKCVIDSCLAESPHYLKRFQVKPGITSVGAMFSPHFSTKELQFRLDMIHTKNRRIYSDLVCLSATTVIVLRKIIKKFFSLLYEWFLKVASNDNSPSLLIQQYGKLFVKGNIDLLNSTGERCAVSRYIAFGNRDDALLPSSVVVSDVMLNEGEYVRLNLLKRVWRNAAARRTIRVQLSGHVESCLQLRNGGANNAQYMVKLKLGNIRPLQVYYLERYFT